MTLYQCPKCNLKKDVTHLSLKIIDGKIVCPETLCKCGQDMINKENEDGYPDIIRTEPTFRKK